MAEDPSISVCICTYNGAERVGLVLEALAAQTDRSSAWEVLVIDNASRDGTGGVVLAAFAAHLPERGRIVREERPGLMHARRRATDEARGGTIVFLDDDNIPAPDYIERLRDILRQHPRVGVMGGRVEAEWLGEPTALGKAVANFALAVCDRGDQAFAYHEVTGGPAGAGMVVSRALLRTIFEEASLAERVTGRDASGFGGGEDTAIVIRAHQLGYECRYEPSLLVKHRIPASRTDPAYLLKLYEGIGRGQASMRPLFDPRAKSPVLGVLIALKEGLRWVGGALRGPSRALRREHGDQAAGVHRLQQRQLYGRFRQGLREPFR
jgi:glycosyltransferase involved in cell wall biosynthesis